MTFCRVAVSLRALGSHPFLPSHAVFAAHSPPHSDHPPHASPGFRVHWRSTLCRNAPFGGPKGAVSSSPDGLFAQNGVEPTRGRPAMRGKGMTKVPHTNINNPPTGAHAPPTPSRVPSTPPRVPLPRLFAQQDVSPTSMPKVEPAQVSGRGAYRDSRCRALWATGGTPAVLWNTFVGGARRGSSTLWATKRTPAAQVGPSVDTLSSPD